MIFGGDMPKIGQYIIFDKNNRTYYSHGWVYSGINEAMIVEERDLSFQKKNLVRNRLQLGIVRDEIILKVEPNGGLTEIG
jgi:hypothetical protein